MKRDITPNYRKIQKQAKRREMIINTFTLVGSALLGMLLAQVLIVGLWAINY